MRDSQRMKKLSDNLAAWVKEQVNTAGAKGIVIGLSGGIDSAVAAVICKKAFLDDILALLLPCYSSPSDMDHALMVADKFNIPSKVIVLDEVFELLRNLFAERGTTDEQERAPGVSVKDLALANVKARLRMTSLYYFANHLNYLVAGSGNKSELSIGYFTKYGDGGVDILPMGNLLKSEVRELAIFLGIPREIVQKPPSAGLWEGQTDEAEMGVTYEVLDSYLSTGNVASDASNKIKRLIEESEHKRKMPPVPPF